MTTLLKRDGNKKLPTFPKVNTADDFRKRFLKLAKYLGKIAETSEVNHMESLKLITRNNLEGYQLSSYEDAPESVQMIAKSIAINKAKLEDMSNVLVAHRGYDMAYIILPTAPMSIDGAWFVSRRNRYGKSREVRVFSLGFLLLAAMLNSGIDLVEDIIKGDEVTNIFKYTNTSWKYCRGIKYYEWTLETLFKLEYNKNLNSQYASGVKKTISTFHTDKKYQDEELNAKTIFNETFRKVEVDTQRYEGKSFDYFEFARVENDYKQIMHLLPQAMAKPELRFRKLGKHKAKGLYSSDLNVIAVDVRHTESFLHEYGHYLDFKHGEEVYSESAKFSRIIDAYTNRLNDLLKDPRYAFLINKFSYFCTPTEIFARGFELWAQANITSKSSLLKNKEEYNESPEYMAFSNVKRELFAFYDSIFPSTKAVSIPLVADKVDAKIVSEPVYEQLKLF